mgnify:CR=1 FL=1
MSTGPKIIAAFAVPEANSDLEKGYIIIKEPLNRQQVIDLQRLWAEQFVGLPEEQIILSGTWDTEESLREAIRKKLLEANHE